VSEYVSTIEAFDVRERIWVTCGMTGASIQRELAVLCDAGSGFLVLVCGLH
jgi:hypothetical protein